MIRFGPLSSLGLIVVMLISITGIVRASSPVPLAPLVPNMVSVVTGTNGDLYWNGFYTDHWGGWQPLSGGSPSPPGLCQSGTGRLELVVQGYDENIYHKSFSAGSWSPTWDKVPTGATSDQPACAVLGTTMHMVVKGTDYDLWANSLDLNAGTWSAWVNLGGSSPSPPALAASPSIGALDLVVRGTDNKVYHKFYASGTWSAAWDCASCGTFLRAVTTPAIVSGNRTGTNLVQVAVAMSDGTVRSLLEYAGSSWNTLPRFEIGIWESTGVGSQNPPTLVVDPFGPPNPNGTVYSIVRGSDSAVDLSSRGFDLTSNWGAYSFGSGGNTGNRPAGALLASGKIGVVVSGASKDLWYNSFTCCGLWSGWTAMTGSTGIDPGLIAVA